MTVPAFARGLPIRIVASQSRITPGANHFSLVLRNDLAGEIVSYKDPNVFAQMVAHGVDPNGRVNADSLQADQEWFVAHGKQQAPVPMDQVVDHQYVDAALATLGILN